MSLDALMADAARISARATLDRKEALRVVVQGCRALEKALMEALGDEPLRGLPDIGATQVRVYAARLRTKLNKPFPRPDDPMRGRDRYLAINAHGQLMVFWWEDGDLCEREADDEDFRIGDLESMIRALQIVLPRHILKTERTTAGYARARSLGQRLETVLGRN